jgi:hypothetical protein
VTPFKDHVGIFIAHSLFHFLKLSQEPLLSKILSIVAIPNGLLECFGATFNA